MSVTRSLLRGSRYGIRQSEWQLLLSLCQQPWLPFNTVLTHQHLRPYSTQLYNNRGQSPFNQATNQYCTTDWCILLKSRNQQRSLFGHPASTKYDERKLIGYSPEQMFKVVAQVEDYHKFVPWCVKSTVVKRNPTNYIECDLEIGFQVFVERYTSKIRLNPPNSLTTITEDSTLFHHLESLWKFEKGPTADTCWLSFHVDFAFKSPLYKHVATVFFEEVVQRMMAAFIGRCEQLYGPSSLTPSPRSNKSVRIA